MKGHVAASLLIMMCFGSNAQANNSIDSLLAAGKIPEHSDWDFIYTEKSHFELCKLSVEVIYASGAMDRNMTSITNFKNVFTLTTWTPKHGVRIDCNSYQNSVLILTADYIVP